MYFVIVFPPNKLQKQANHFNAIIYITGMHILKFNSLFDLFTNFVLCQCLVSCPNANKPFEENKWACMHERIQVCLEISILRDTYFSWFLVDM